MNILAIETATPMCSVALSVRGDVRSRRQLVPRGHASLVLPWIEQLLAEAGLGYADVDRLAVGTGPGGFTSLRIGLGVAQGVALAHDVAIAPVSSLAALAYVAGSSSGSDPVLALIDARMGEVFAGWFQIGANRLVELAGEVVCAPEAVTVPVPGRWRVAGSGLSTYLDIIQAGLGDQVVAWQPEIFPLAEAVIELSALIAPVPAWQLEPNYLRDQVTQG